MYEDNRLPAYVDYLGSILPILDRQSVTNWPGTPHPLTGQVQIMPYNAANLPTVPYILNIGNRGLTRAYQGPVSSIRGCSHNILWSHVFFSI